MARGRGVPPMMAGRGRAPPTMPRVVPNPIVQAPQPEVEETKEEPKVDQTP